MLKKTSLLLIAIVIFSIDLPSANAQTDVYLKIYSKTFQRMKIDLYPFQSPGSGKDAEVMAALISEVLQNDLWMSGFFQVTLQNEPYSSSNGQTGALAAITGQFSLQENGGLAIKPTLIDAASQRAILNRDYTAAVKDRRFLVHRIADEIVYSLTGESGIATTRIAYVTEKGNNQKEIAIMDYDGENSRTITSDRSINISPAWAPDGSRLCYTSFKHDNPDLFVLDLRSNTKFRISNIEGLNTAPAWAPDGEHIALTLTKDGNAELYLLSVDNKKLRRLTYNRAIDSSPSWSPSNREIAFTSDRSGSPQIYIMDSDGANVRRLTFQGNYNDSPTWSPRGDRIAFVSRTDSGFDIYTIDITGDNLLRLTDSSGANEDPSWAPNGFSLIFSSNRKGSKQIYTMFWDGSEQKPLTSGVISYLPAWSPRIN